MLLDLTRNLMNKLDNLFSENPDASVDLIIYATKIKEKRMVQVGYSDPIEYMMSNDGDYPPEGTLCHGETDTVTDVYALTQEGAECIKYYYSVTNPDTRNFESFARFLYNNCNLSKNFANFRYIKIKEISSKHVSKCVKKKAFSKRPVSRPRFWSNKSNPKMLIVQPDRRKPYYFMYNSDCFVFEPNCFLKD